MPPSPVKNLFYKMSGIQLERQVFIGEYAYIVDGFRNDLIELKAQAVLSPRTTLVAMALPGDSFIAKEFDVVRIGKISVGEGAWLGTGVVVLPGVSIGKGAIIGANSVVNKDVGEYEVWAGSPARFIRLLKESRKK